MSVWSAIYTTLTGDTTLNGLVTGGFHYQKAPPKGSMTPAAAMPYVVYWSPGGPPPDFSTGTQLVEYLHLQFDVFAETDATAEAIALQLAHVLDTTGQSMTLGTATEMALIRTSPIDALEIMDERSENGLSVFHVPLLYELWQSRTK